MTFSPPDNRHFIEAFFDDFEDRCRFVAELLEAGRDVEATILCCAYIEGIANNLYPNSKDSAQNFATALAEHGGDGFLMAIVPTFTLEALPRARAIDKQALAALEPVLTDRTELLDPEQVIAALRSDLLAEVVQAVRSHLWRGSIANLAYVHIRSAMFKRALGSSSIAFSGHTYHSEPAPSLTTGRLSAALGQLLAWTRGVSLSTNRWFGTIG